MRGAASCLPPTSWAKQKSPKAAHGEISLAVIACTLDARSLVVPPPIAARNKHTNRFQLTACPRRREQK